MKRIPKEFYSSEGQIIITDCKICGKDLQNGETPFALEKAVKIFPEIEASESIFEIAICHNCAGESRRSLSAQSLKDIEDFMRSDQIRENMTKCLAEAEEHEGDTLRYCIITGASKDTLNEYQIVAQCQGSYLLPGTEAFLISAAGVETIQDLLSPETKEELDRFKDEHFGLPPEFENIFNPGDLVLI